MSDAPHPATRPRVSLDAEAWRLIDALLAELPYRITAPIVEAIKRSGGAQPCGPACQAETDDA